MEQYPVMKKKKSPLPKIIAAVAAVGLIAGGVYAGVRFFKKTVQPVTSVVKAVENSLDAAERAEVYELTHAVLNGGSMEVSGSAAELTKTLVGASIDARLNATAYFDAENTKTEVQASASLGGTELADLLVYADNTAVSAESEVLFGSRALGVDLTKFREHYRSSAFSTGGAYDLGLDTAEICDLVDAVVANTGKREERKELAIRVLVKLGEIVQKNAVITMEEGTVTAAGNEIATTDVRAEADGHQFVAIVREIRDDLRSGGDAELENAVDGIAGALGRIDPDLGSSALLYEKMDDAVAKLEEMEADGKLDDFRARVVFHISPDTQLIGTDLSADNGEKDVSVSFICGPDWSKPAEIRIGAESNTDDLFASAETGLRSEPVYLQAAYAVSEDTEDRYAAGASLMSGGEEVVRASVDWKRTDGDLSASVSFGGERYALYGKLFKTDDGAELTVDSVTFANTVYALGGIEIRLNRDAVMPARRESYDDVLTMREDEVAKLADDISGFVEDVSGEITRILIFSAISGIFGGN